MLMTETEDVTAQIVDAVRRFVEREVMPVASELEHADEYPQTLITQMRELGLFGATIPSEYGGLGLSATTYAMIIQELARGWMSLTGVLNTHLILAYLLKTNGTAEQKERYLPAMATGEHRGAFCLTEPHAGSDAQRIRTTAVRQGRPLRHQRLEDVHHQRAHGDVVRRGREDQSGGAATVPRRQRLLCRKGRPRRHRRPRP